MEDFKDDKHSGNEDSVRPLNKLEQRIFDDMKSALEIVKLHQKGEIKLKSAWELLDEL